MPKRPEGAPKLKYKTRKDKGVKRTTFKGRPVKEPYVRKYTYKGRPIGEARYSKVNKAQRKLIDGQCTQCGAMGKLHVHHIDCFGPHKTSAPDNSLNNLITLCINCHRQTHAQACHDRRQEVLQRYHHGETFTAIGLALGVSRQRAYAIYKAAIASAQR